MASNLMNRLHNCRNDYQGSFKRVLCVCSAGLLRSPTTALVLSGEPYNFNTRACGITPQYALVPMDEVLLAWADEIVCMEPQQLETIKLIISTSKIKIRAEVFCLDIEDSFPYRDPELVKQIREKYDKLKPQAEGSEQ